MPELRPVHLNIKEQNQLNYRKTAEALQSIFPVETTRYRIELSGLTPSSFDVTFENVKDAVLKKSSLTSPVFGTVTLKTLDGKVLDTKSHIRILSLPLLTPLHTFILDGTQYAVTNQLRLKPGVYTKRSENGETLAFFNLSRGGSFRIRLEPETGIFYWVIGTAKKSLPLYPLLIALGIGDQQISSVWGSELLNINRDQTLSKRSAVVSALYEKFVFPSEKKTSPSEQEQVRAILKAFNERTELDAKTTMSTLGRSYTTLTPMTLLDSTKKILGVFQNKIDEDERDSLEFKKLVTIDDFFKETLIKERGRKVVNKLKARLNAASGIPELSKVFYPGMFTSAVTNFITTESLSGNPDQINPVEILDQKSKVTPLGPGGIPSINSVTNIQRMVHPSHLGILDPIRTPENEKAGLDVRVVGSAKRDEQGNLYAPLVNVKTKKVEYVNPGMSKNYFIAFEDPSGKRELEILHSGIIERLPASKATHYLGTPDLTYSESTNLLPFLGNMQGNRAIMGSKQTAQALPLKHSEIPLIQTLNSRFGISNEKVVAENILHKAPVTGTVVRLTDNEIVIKDDKTGEKILVSLANNLPLNSKTYLHDRVKDGITIGSRVTKGEVLTDNNFTKDQTLALGTNLQVAYMPFHGYVHEDSVVISDTASKKLTSSHMYRKSIDINKDVVLNKQKFKSFYPNYYTPESLNKLDEYGIVKINSIVDYGDPIILVLRRSQPSSTNILLGKLHKTFNNPYQDASVTWDKKVPGQITDVKFTKSSVVVTVKVEAPALEGDKVGGRHGNKGVIAKVVPDDQMPKTEGGKTVDIIMTPVGVISRINPSQLLETAVSKVAEKTGKPIIIDNFDKEDKVKWAKNLLAEHGLKDKENVIDPMSGKTINNVMTGKQYLLKLHKTVDTNFSARSIGGYDADQQPLKGGETGSKGLGMMEVNVLLAHNARNILKEISTIKSQKNDDYWNAVKTGKPLPTPKDNFAYDKMMGMIRGMNIKVNKDKSYLSFAPMTDSDVDKISSGQILNPKQVRSKDLLPEPGGLFDFSRTGGLNGNKWSHIDLHEPIVNPIFNECVQRLLGISRASDFEKIKLEKGGAWIRDQLKKIDINKKEAELKAAIPRLRNAELDNAVKLLKYISALKANNLTPDKAYVMGKLPVLPPVMRPISASRSGGSLIVSGPNYLYRDLMLINSALKDVKTAKLPETEIRKARGALIDSVSSVQGLSMPNSPQLQNKNVQGFLANLTGGEGKQPKEGFIQSTLMSRNSDFTGRGTASPDPNLAIDQIGIPIDQAWTMYEPFIMRQLALRGYNSIDAKKMIDNRADLAKIILENELKSRPVLINRAPSLWKSNIVAAYPKLIPGKVLKVQSMMEEGMNLDYDGDALTLHVPVEPKAVEEARKMTLRYNLFSDKSKDDLLVKPSQEPVLGIWGATAKASTNAVKTFANKADAWKSYITGKINLNDRVTIKDKNSAFLKESTYKDVGTFGLGLLAGAGTVHGVSKIITGTKERLRKQEEKNLLERDYVLSQKAGVPSLIELADKQEGGLESSSKKIKVPTKLPI